MDLVESADRSQTVLVPQRVQRAWIPDEFKQAILLHIIKNNIDSLNAPLILAIQGRTGEGKSYQTREVCSLIGVYVVPVSGALLSGPHEKEAVQVLEKAYVHASNIKGHYKEETVLLIDDFDLSVSSTFDDRRYTVNTQLLNGFLMNLTDDPLQCGMQHTFRIPIIVTGNNFRALHVPLVRHGRVNFFNWTPTLEQKKQIVHSLFVSVLSKEEVDQLEKFVKSYFDQPLSFFAALKGDMVDEVILQTIDREKVIRWDSIKREAEIALQSQSVNIAMLENLAKRRKVRVARDYIGM